MKEAKDITFGELERIAVKTRESFFDHKNEGRMVGDIRKEILSEFDLDSDDMKTVYLCKGFCMAYYELKIRYEGRITP